MKKQALWMTIILLLAGLSACSAKAPEAMSPGPAETAAPADVQAEKDHAGSPEAAPPAAESPEVVPPAATPPEAALSEAALSEAAPPVDVALSRELAPALRQLGWGPWSAGLLPGYRGELTFQDEYRCALEIYEMSSWPDVSVGYEGDYEIIAGNEGGNASASIHFELYMHWTRGDAAVFAGLPYELSGDYTLDFDNDDAYTIGMRLERGDELFSLGGSSPAAYVFEQVYWYDPPTSPAIRDHLIGSWTCGRSGGLTCRMEVEQNDFNGDLCFYVDFFGPDGERAYGRYLEGHITSSSWWDDDPEDRGEITFYIHGKAMDPESYRFWEGGEGRKMAEHEGKFLMGLYALQGESLFGDVKNGEEPGLFLFEKAD